jgi:hypothetical protein
MAEADYRDGLSTEKGRSMWARVRGATENALTRLGFAGVALFRFIRR